MVGFDPDPRVRDYAFEADLIDDGRECFEDLWEAAGTLVIAAPLDATLRLLEATASRPSGPQLVLDVASVKAPLVPFAGRARFVPTHPLAGAERSGPEAARADLFVDRPWVYVPVREELDAAARAFIESMGARPVALEAARHDRIVALTSHLPQLLSSLLADLLSSQEDPAIAQLYGPGLESMLRLARSPWSMWAPILSANSEQLGPVLQAFSDRVRTAGIQLDRADLAAVALLFEHANAFVARLGEDARN